VTRMNIFVDHRKASQILSRDRLFRDNYSDRVADGVELPSRAVAVICIEGGSVVAIGAFRRGGRITTFDRRYEVSNLELLEQRVSLAGIQERLRPQLKSHLEPAISGKATLPNATSEDFARVLSLMSDGADALIERAGGSQQSIAAASESRRLLLAEEKDSFGLIADLCGLGRGAGDPGRQLIVPDGDVDPSRTFLETARLQYSVPAEDSQLSRDNDEEALLYAEMARFDGFMGEHARSNARGMIIPHRQGNIAVLNTNNRPLESLHGCDLIYYNVPRQSAVMVQYKRMKAVDDKWVYRGDRQLEKQLASMRAHVRDLIPKGVAQYRLNPEIDYLKIVRPVDYDGRSAELMEGMYLPLSLVELMLRSDDDTTANGNLLITRQDKRYPTQRHINNTTFTQLFRDGWIGSCGTTSDEIRNIVDRQFDEDDLVTLAIDERVRNPYQGN
jgi:hypothetical protein